MKTINYNILTFAVIGVFAMFPLLFSLPFRIHLDLPWEGTYRLYLGQVPYKDFGMPLGYGFFLIPLFCFYVFGTSLKSLLLAQVIVTVLSATVLNSILKLLKVPAYKAFIATTVFCISYTFIYFWPWYNNTAFMYEMLGIWAVLKAFEAKVVARKYVFYLLSSLFVFLTFFTKQDYGGLAFIFCGVLVAYHAIVEKKYTDLAFYLGSVALVSFLFIYPLTKFEFGYWFNYGQAPHESRLSVFKLLDEIFLNSSWEKFYLLVLGVYAYKKIFVDKLDVNKVEVLTFLITAGIVLQALITKSTSGNALGNTTYYHAFGVSFILLLISEKYVSEKLSNVLLILVLCFVWFSGDYWKYINRMFPVQDNKSTIAKKEDTVKQVTANWVVSDLKTFSNVKLPEATILGIKSSKKVLDSLKIDKPRILNMTEMTMLAKEWNYEPIKGIPLWYHVGIGMFQKQIDEINARISNNEYDMVLFETVPQLDQFFPDDVLAQLKLKYKERLAYLAPRKDGDAFIHVFIKK